MAGLLETIARRLFGSTQPTRTAPKTAYIPAPYRPVTDTKVPEEQPIQVTPVKDYVFERTIKRERTHREVEREDYLLTQIDEFREKAQHLQSLLLSKETKVAELQNIVDEREGKARELESILTERQRKADGITQEVTKQIDSLIDRVSAKMDEIGNSLNTSISGTIGQELTESRKLSEQQLAGLEELKELLASITPQLESAKAELSDKVHAENVKCYRNIADLFKSMEDKMDRVKDVQNTVEAVRRGTIYVILLTIFNMLGLMAFALYELGVFQMLLG